MIMEFDKALSKLNSTYLSQFMSELAQGASLSLKEVKKQNSSRSSEYIADHINSRVNFDFHNHIPKYTFIKRFREKVINDDIENLNAWNNKISKLKLQDNSINDLFRDHVSLLTANQRKCFEGLLSALNCNIIENRKDFLFANLNYESDLVIPTIFIDASSISKPKTFSLFCNLEFKNRTETSINIDLGKLNYALEFLKVSPDPGHFSKYEFNSLELYNITMSVLVFKVFCSTVLSAL